MRSWVPGNLGRRRLPARPDGEARPRVTCRLVGKSSQGSRQLGGETRTPARLLKGCLVAVALVG
jgi:hypothetical protein